MNHKTAISRIKPEVLAEFDHEVKAWAERICLAPELVDRWPERNRSVLRYRRQRQAKRDYAAPRLILAYLHFITDEVVSKDISVSPHNRRMLGRTIARIEERLHQMGAPL